MTHGPREETGVRIVAPSGDLDEGGGGEDTRDERDVLGGAEDGEGRKKGRSSIGMTAFSKSSSSSSPLREEEDLLPFQQSEQRYPRYSRVDPCNDSWWLLSRSVCARACVCVCVQMLAGDEDRWRERVRGWRVRVRACVGREGRRAHGEPGTMATSFNYKVR